MRVRLREEIFFTICPVCRAEACSDNVYTAMREIEQHNFQSFKVLQWITGFLQ